MRVLGLTGSVGMGKSTAAAMLRRMRLPVWDADLAVHRLYAKGGAAVASVGAAFPGAVRDGAIDRSALGSRVLGQPEALRRLEAIVHPLTAAATRRFLAQARRRRAPLVVLEVPLLLEGSAAALCDVVAVVSAPAVLQRQRVFKRPGMSPARLAAILARQMPDAEKRRHADIVIATGLGRAHTQRALRRLVRLMQTRAIPSRRRKSRCARSSSIRKPPA